MARLIYSAITSLDGYIEDDSGKFDWAEPDEEVHTFANDLERSVGTHLYGRRRDVFRHVTLPLSMPGVVAGVLLTFIPAAGDFINAQLLGTPKQYMIGNVIQSRFLVVNDYPTASALSFLLMAFMLVLVIIWARIAGTEALLGTEGERA